MPTTPNNSNSANQSPTVALSAAFLALRERSRVLLRERSNQLHELEGRLQDQVAQLVAEMGRPQVTATESDSTRKHIAALEAEIRDLQQLRHDSEQALDEARIMLVEMEDERRALRERSDAGEAPCVQPAVHNDSAELERLQRRLEMALQEIRELKHQNEELTSRPSQPAPQHRTPDVDMKSFDWESQKQRLLQQLETDFDARQPEQAKDKLRIEDVIRNTDRIVAEKDRELDELRQLLATQSAGVEANTTDMAARDQLLDADATVTVERDRLNQLQDEWREKLRKSEVEISIERAKLARERLQMEERLRSLQDQSANADDEAKRTDDPKSGNPPRGRWLTRLGLGGTE